MNQRTNKQALVASPEDLGWIHSIHGGSQASVTPVLGYQHLLLAFMSTYRHRTAIHTCNDNGGKVFCLCMFYTQRLESVRDERLSSCLSLCHQHLLSLASTELTFNCSWNCPFVYFQKYRGPVEMRCRVTVGERMMTQGNT